MFESPYLDSELDFAAPAVEVGHNLARAIGASPFADFVDMRGAEPGQPLHSGGSPPSLETFGLDQPLAETWLGEEPEYEEESAYSGRAADFDLETVIEAERGYTGDDDRNEVGDTTIPPYRWICSVSYEKDGRTLDGGTGFLISNRHVLTAGHVITNAGSGPAAPSIYVYPGRYYGGEPFGKFSVAKTRVSTPGLDFGLITLNRAVDQGVLWWGAPNTKTAWWSEALLPAQQLLRTAIPISTAGYPGVKDAYRRRMYRADGFTMPGSFGGIFRHTADTTEGQSGSPIWTERGGLHVLLGIATSYDQMPGQRATWVGVFRRNIERWMAEDAPRVPKVERRIALEIPYRWICRLEVYDNDLRRVVGYGTGLLISNRHVLTAATVIHDFSRNGRRYSVRIIPAYEFGKEAFGSTTASKARVSPKFSPENKEGSTDYGLLTLSQPLGSAVFSSIGNTALGNWGNESHGLSTTPADWSGKAAHIAAFSRSSGGGAGYHKLRISTGTIVGLQRGQILHKASSKLDAPGAPIWIEAGKRRLLVGIVSSLFSKDSELNLGCYLSQETQNQLMQWVNADYEQPELEIRNLSQDELEFVSASPNTEAEDRVGETNPEPEDEDLYSQFYEREPDKGEGIAERKETGDLESDEELDWLIDDLDEQEDDFLSHPAETDFRPEHEFQLKRLPQKSQDLFGQGRGSWRAAVAEAIGAGFRDHYDLADLVFFMHHPERMAAGVGKSIERKDPDFVKLRSEWNKYRGLVIDILRSPTTAPCGFFLPANPSKNYEDYMAAPTTGRIKLMINGRNSGGKGGHNDMKEAFDSMQSEVEALGPSDSIYLSAWMFDPTVLLTTTSATGAKTWGELMQFKAAQGVKIRILMNDFSPVASYLRDRVYQTFLPALDKLIGQLSASTRDNLKYIVSRHPATQLRIHVATHHQKFMILKKGAATTAFCGGLDIAYMRTPAYWTAPNYLWYWHDIHTRMEGLIARDLESEFILRWNREKGALSVARSPHTGTNAFEDLVQPSSDAADRMADINTQRLQMIRTVSVQGVGSAIQNTTRDDIWQAYLRLISCASQFIFMENQYFREPRMADAIVRQAKVHPELIVIIVVPEQLDDPEDAIKSHGNWLQNKFFKRLFAGIGSKRLRIYTMFHRIIHSKFILVDDRALSVGSANANPRGFFLDTELNVILDDSETVKGFRHKLWAHELGIPESTVAGWDVSNFIAKWDAVAKANKALKKAPDDVSGEGVIPFDPKSVKGEEQKFISNVLTET